MVGARSPRGPLASSSRMARMQGEMSVLQDPSISRASRTKPVPSAEEKKSVTGTVPAGFGRTGP